MKQIQEFDGLPTVEEHLNLRDLAIQYLASSKVPDLLKLVDGEEYLSDCHAFVSEPLRRYFQEDGEIQSEMVSTMDIFLACGPELSVLVEVKPEREPVTDIIRAMKFYEDCLATNTGKETIRMVLVTCYPLTEVEVKLLWQDSITVAFLSPEKLRAFSENQTIAEVESF